MRWRSKFWVKGLVVATSIALACAGPVTMVMADDGMMNDGGGMDGGGMGGGDPSGMFGLGEAIGGLIGEAIGSGGGMGGYPQGDDYPNYYPQQPDYQPPQYYPQQPEYQAPQYYPQQPPATYYPQQPAYQPPPAPRPRPNALPQPRAVAPRPNAVPLPRVTPRINVVARPNPVPAPRVTDSQASGAATPSAPRANSLPSHSPAPAVKRVASAPHNKNPRQVPYAPAAVRQGVVDDLDSMVSTTGGMVARHAQDAGLTPGQITSAVNGCVDRHGATPQQTKTIEDAVRRGDAQAVDNLLKGLGVGAWERPLGRAAAGAAITAMNAANEFTNLASHGASAGELEEAAGRLSNALGQLAGATGSDHPAAVAMGQAARDAAALAALSEIIRFANPNDGWQVPHGPITIVDATQPANGPMAGQGFGGGNTGGGLGSGNSLAAGPGFGSGGQGSDGHGGGMPPTGQPSPIGPGVGPRGASAPFGPTTTTNTNTTTTSVGNTSNSGNPANNNGGSNSSNGSSRSGNGSNNGNDSSTGNNRSNGNNSGNGSNNGSNRGNTGNGNSGTNSSNGSSNSGNGSNNNNNSGNGSNIGNGSNNNSGNRSNNGNNNGSNNNNNNGNGSNNNSGNRSNNGNNNGSNNNNGNRSNNGNGSNNNNGNTTVNVGPNSGNAGNNSGNSGPNSGNSGPNSGNSGNNNGSNNGNVGNNNGNNSNNRTDVTIIDNIDNSRNSTNIGNVFPPPPVRPLPLGPLLALAPRVLLLGQPLSGGLLPPRGPAFLPPGATGPRTGPGTGYGARPPLRVYSGMPSDVRIPVMSGRPLASAPGSTQMQGEGILLMAGKDLGATVNYNLSGNPYEMQPGYRQKLDGSRTWTVEFDRGGSFGQAQYTLSSGTYEWVIIDRGWDLNQRTFQVTVDNTANANEFNYVLGDQQDVVPGGQTKLITGKFPLVLTFDRGDGKEPIKKELLEGTFRVGMDVASNLMDLFPGSAPLLADASDPSAGAGAAPVPAASPDDTSPLQPPARPAPLAPPPAPALSSTGGGA